MAVYEKNNRWYVKFVVRGKQYHQACPEATNEHQAKIIETRIKSDILQGKYQLVEARGKILFDVLVNKYIEHSQNNNKAWEKESYRVKQVAKYFKGKRIDEITPALLEEFKFERKNRITRRGTEASNATINRELALIKKMFSIAVLNDWIDKNPCLACRVKLLPENNEIIRYLSNAEERRLIEACSDDYIHLHAIVLTAVQTGMRFGEITQLKWKENIDLKNGYITLTRDMTKSKKKRVIPMSSILQVEFKELSKNKLGEWVFMNPKTNKPYRDIRSAWTSVKKIAEIPPEFRFHDLRHHMASKLVENNVNPVIIKDLLGHSTLTVTQKYAHPKDQTKKLAIEFLAQGY